MNLAVHGLAGDIRQANSYYEDLHNAPGKFDFVMANPPFNVDRVDKEILKDDRARFPFGMPRADNANYLWIQLFYSALNENGRSGFVMANSASDARQSELEIRVQLIQSGAVDVMVAIGSNFFYTVTLPCTLWFLDRGKCRGARLGTVLFLDARSLFTQVDRAHREFSQAHTGLIASLVRLYRGEDLNGFQFNPSAFNLTESQISNLQSAYQNQQYLDVPGLCKVATLAEIEAQGWSLNPGRYVGVAERDADKEDFYEKLESLNEELEVLKEEARELEERIAENMMKMLAL
jgi:type I restriction enzyme M protein